MGRAQDNRSAFSIVLVSFKMKTLGHGQDYDTLYLVLDEPQGSITNVQFLTPKLSERLESLTDNYKLIVYDYFGRALHQ